MPDTSGAFDLGNLSAEEQERLDQMTEKVDDQEIGEGEGGRESVSTAFVVAIDWDGRVGIHPLTEAGRFAPGADPTNDQLTAVGAILQKDVIVAESADRTIQMQMMAAAQMREQAEAARIAQATAGGVDLSNLGRR